MKFSYNWLQSYFKKELPKPEKLAEILTLRFAEVESVSREGEDFILDIDVRPNRAGDCFSHRGIAREIAAITSSKLQAPNANLQQNEEKNLKAKDFISLEVKIKNACPRYAARVMTNVKVFPSPKWIQERLKTCGLRPINNIVDATNYVMLELGQPLHAFDFDKLENDGASGKTNPKSIIVRFARAGEKISTLDEENYELEDKILVISDKVGPLAIAGIKGGKKAEIGVKTKTIVLESANFDSRVIRGGSRSIDLKTDASLRFEHGLDPNLAEIALNRVASLIQQVSGGKAVQGIVDFYSQKVLPKSLKLDLDYAVDLLGVEIPEAKIKNILEKLGFKSKLSRPKAKAAALKSKILEVEIPTGRMDVNLPEDLIEEIGRIFGYEKIPVRAPQVSLTTPERNPKVFWEDRARDILKDIGFIETYNYSFISEKDLEVFRSFRKEDVVELANPLSYDFQYLRPSLIPNVLRNIERNQKNFSEIKIFELGKVFGKAPVLSERQMLVGALTGERFYEAKGAVDLLLAELGLGQAFYEEYRPSAEESKSPIWYPQKVAEIKVGLNQEKIGVVGEVAPRVSGNLKIEKKVIVFDLDFEKIVSLASEERKYCPISRYPSALRDIAVLVPKAVKAKEVLAKIKAAGGELISNLDLFDIYEGDNLPPDRKNLAFHVIFQSDEKTLSPNEIDEIQAKIIKALEENPEWKVRK